MWDTDYFYMMYREIVNRKNKVMLEQYDEVFADFCAYSVAEAAEDVAAAKKNRHLSKLSVDVSPALSSMVKKAHDEKEGTAELNEVDAQATEEATNQNEIIDETVPESFPEVPEKERVPAAQKQQQQPTANPAVVVP